MINKEKTCSKKISNLLQNLAEKDAILLSKESEFSLFFSVLQSGIPFHPGWFAGAMLSITKTHCLTLTKSETGNIKLAFTRKKKTSSSLLLGTGQGLESKLLYRGSVDFLSIMPFEENIILSIYKIKS
ncbi:MAG: hypothetical protein ACMZI0_18315 [Symbiopectobacterium sp.]|uniref:hypothetical protein n=1 Tax=Symbiopectobacterium sp. TaxID=2952789 RepID=UPI0039E739A1